MAFLIVTLYIASSGVPCHAQVAAGDAAATARGAGVAWGAQPTDGASPAPNELVRVHVRGEVLAALLNADAEWRLTAGGDELPALLQLPQATEPPVRTTLTIIEQSAVDERDLVAVLDRGEWPDPIDKLSISLAVTGITAVAHLEASTAGEEYAPLGEPQVLAQRFAATGILRLTELDCPVGDERYLKLRVTAAGGGSLESAEAWHTGVRGYSLHEVQAALGPMRNLEGGEHLWPLLVAEPGLPPVKLKVLATAPDQMRRLRVVQLDERGQLIGTVATAIWASEISAGGHSRTEKWVELPLLRPGGKIGIVVEDQEQAALELTGVQAYAAEGALYFAMPDAQPVELWLEAPALPRLVLSDDELAAAMVAGTLSTLDLALSAVVESSSRGAWDSYFYDWLTPLMARWGKLTGYALGGLVCIIIGLVLLRRRRGER